MSAPGRSKAIKRMGDLGMRSVGAALAKPIHTTCDLRVRDHPITLDKVLAGMA